MFGDLVQVSVNPMPLRAIFVTLARTDRRPRRKEITVKQLMHIFKKDIRYLW